MFFCLIDHFTMNKNQQILFPPRASALTYIGTSGIVIPGNKQTFPDEFKNQSRLHYYSSLFNTLEINSSFYKIPLAKTFEKWAGDVADNFTFTVKCWRGITHVKNLNFAKNDIELFMTSANALGSRSGCILIQFPASISILYLNKVEELLGLISQKNIRQQWRLAVEVRHSSWYCDAAYDVFQKHNTAIVIHDMPGSPTPLSIPINDFIYLRFHGPTGNYNGSYSEEHIRLYAEKIEGWRKSVSSIYVYFNNTIGAAFENAQHLKHIIATV
jgi:uncharacterized protein YecE (DUF72 family)